MSELIKKYNVQGPRYTSYPTVPYWENNLTEETYKSHITNTFKSSNSKEGISLYIHLPYCRSLCTFCGCNTRITVNHAVERPYIESLLNEWLMYLAIFDDIPNIREIHLGGGTPTFFSPQNLQFLVNEILESGKQFTNCDFGFEAHPNSTTSEHLKVLYELGFRRLSLGIQDFDPKVQDIINRIQTFGQVKKITLQARKMGYTSINYDLIYGLPFQTESSVKMTIEKVKELMPDRIAFYSYAHIPWIKPGQRRFTEIDLPDNEQKLSLYKSGREMLLDAGYIDIGMDHFSLPTDSLYLASENRQMHRNFMGYTHLHTNLQIGLGVSAIGDTWTSFGQNLKTVEEYQEAINKGMLPIFRGHVLSTEDLILRRHILNLMCYYETEWKNNSEEGLLIFPAIERLKEPLKDQLILLKKDALKIPEKGKPFLRNICMAFDARLWQNQPEKEVFSKVI